MVKKYIIVVGSEDEDTKRTIFAELFNLNYETTQGVYQFQDFSIIEKCDSLESQSEIDNFRVECDNIRANIKYILCIEKLNPRPQTLDIHLEILRGIFSKEELNEKLNIIFTSDNLNNLKSLRANAVDFNGLYDLLGITEFKDISNFINTKMWLNNQNELNRLKEMLLKKKKNHFKFFIIGILVLACGIAVSFTPLPTINEFDEIGFNKEIENSKEYLIKLGDILKKYADTSNKKFEILTNYITFESSNNKEKDLTVHKLNANSLSTIKEELLKIENDHLDQITKYLDKKFDKLKQVGEEFKTLSKKLIEVGSFFKREKFLDEIHSKELIQIGNELVEYENHLNKNVDNLHQLIQNKHKPTSFNDLIQYILNFFSKFFENL